MPGPFHTTTGKTLGTRLRSSASPVSRCIRSSCRPCSLRYPNRTSSETARRNALSMALPYAQDWSPARIGRELGYCAHTVRRVLKGYQARGLAALHPGRAGRPPDLARRQQVESALRELLPQRRSWTSRQLSEALAAFGIRIKPRQVCAYLRRLRVASVQSPASNSTTSARRQ